MCMATRVAFALRVIRHLGCPDFLLTSAVGSCRVELEPGCLVCVRDDIDLDRKSVV